MFFRRDVYVSRLTWVLGPVLLFLAGPSRADWSASGEVGVQLDSIGEEFGTGAAIDDQIDPDDPLDDVADEIRFQDRSTESTALFSLRVRESSRFLDGTIRLKTRPEKSRAEMDVRGEFLPGPGMWRWQDRLYSEFAGSDADGGWIHLVGATFSTRESRARELQGSWWGRHAVGVSLGLSHELSRAGEDSLASLFDYALLRPRAELFGQFGGVSLTAEGGTQRKRIVDGGDGSYDGSFVELRGVRGRLNVVGRSEARTYEHADSLSPSYQDASGRIDWSHPIGGQDELRVEGALRSLQYATDSTIFRDHLEWNAGLAWRRELGAEPGASKPSMQAGPHRDGSSGDLLEALRDLDGALAELEALEASLGTVPSDSPADLPPDSTADSPADSTRAAPPREEVPAALLALPAAGKWYVELGVLGSGNVGESSDLGDYAEVAATGAVGRQGGERLWLDLSVDLGRRDYVRAGSSTDLVFEGFDFSLSGSDYTFLELSVLGEVGLPGALSFEVFGQYEDQWHDESADDFRLWILTASLTRKF
ncbi:MAG: hypothetical protein R3E97_21295 [Candidatus Eisenbacteria bacterium]